ncbi:MAG: carboxypeptidase-like regulatory domain-containing protein, partial [Rhodothermia bacterium]|nr:carboxypeptidase-like regulatory domain-containing protein [Rhodothermia bacterium]
MLLPVLCLFLSLFPRVVPAQDAAGTLPTYTGAFVGVPLSDALLRLLEETQISIAFESEMVTGPITFCKAVDLSPDNLIKCILRGTGLDFIRLSSGTYVITKPSEAPARVGTLVGRIVDTETLAPLSDANVFLANDDVGASTNSDGRFAIAGVTVGNHSLHVTHVAYHETAYEVTVQPDQRTAIEVGLVPRIVTSAPIVIEGFEHRLPMTRLGTAVPVAGADLLAQAGTRDVLENLGTVSGVHVGSGLSDVHVQGGDTGEHQVRLDGMPVFLPIANAGYFGPFSPDAIGQVTVRKAGFSAAHGSGLSGVVDLTHRLAPARKYSGLASIDPMSTSLQLGGSFG